MSVKTILGASPTTVARYAATLATATKTVSGVALTAPVSFVSSSTAAGNGAVTLSLPSGIQTGDILITVGYSGQITGDPSMTADWTQFFYVTGSRRMAIYWHRYDSSLPPATGFTGAATYTCIAAMLAFRGCVGSGNPVGVVGSVAYGSDASIEHSGVTPTTGGNLLIAANSSQNNYTRSDIPADWASYCNPLTTSGVPNGSVHVMGLESAPLTPSGTVSVTQSGAIAWGSVLFTLIP